MHFKEMSHYYAFVNIGKALHSIAFTGDHAFMHVPLTAFRRIELHACAFACRCPRHAEGPPAVDLQGVHLSACWRMARAFECMPTRVVRSFRNARECIPNARAGRSRRMRRTSHVSECSMPAECSGSAHEAAGARMYRTTNAPVS